MRKKIEIGMLLVSMFIPLACYAHAGMYDRYLDKMVCVKAVQNTIFVSQIVNQDEITIAGQKVIYEMVEKCISSMGSILICIDILFVCVLFCIMANWNNTTLSFLVFLFICCIKKEDEREIAFRDEGSLFLPYCIHRSDYRT